MLILRLLPILMLALGLPARAAPPVPMLPATLTPIGDAEQALARGDDRTAESLLSRIPSGSLDAFQLARVQMVRAEIGLMRHQPETALRSLPPSSTQIPSLSARMELLRGRAQFMAGDPVAAVRTLVARERGLNSPSALLDSHDQIWNGLIATPIPASALAGIASEDPMTRGWLDLARVLQQGPTPTAVAAWLQRNPGHPGASKAAGVHALTTAVAASVEPATGAAVAPVANLSGGFALLLPLSGALGPAGRAVREGFVSAWFDSPEPRAPVRVYDAGANAAQALVAYQAAIRDGARFVIGPLTKDGVAAIAAQANAATWMPLNYLDEPAGAAVQFGLAPEDEARAAAHDALAAGQRRALVLAPANDWGSRTARAFSAAFSAQGGTVLQSASFANGTQDFGQPLRTLLQLDRSTQRHQQLTAALGVPSEFEAQPREDADLIFVAMRSTEARALVPQLNFFHAMRMAAYTVSAANDGAFGNALDGVHLCDMPWVLDNAGRVAAARDRAQANFAETLREQPRLFALGADAFGLAQSIARGEFGSGRDWDGATGRLSLQAGGRIERALSCRTIRDGRVAGLQ